MPKIIERIENFNLWITNDITSKWFQEMEWFDIFSEPWLLKVHKELSNISATFDDTMKDMVRYDLNATTYWVLTDSSIYIVSWTDKFEAHNITWFWSDIKVYKWEMYWSWSNTWIWKSILTELDWGIDDSVATITVDSTTDYPSSWTIVIEKEVITYTWTTATTFTWCTRWDNSSTAVPHTTNTKVIWFIDDFQTFSVDYSGWWIGKHMKVYQNRLYACDGYSLSEWDWTVWTNDKFVLPEVDIITSIETLETQLCLWTSELTSAWSFSIWWGNLYFWDWSSANATNIIRTPLQWITALKEWENTLFAFPWFEWEIYRYNGADLLKIYQIPNYSPSANKTIEQNQVRVFNNWMLFWTRQWLYQLNRLVSWDWFTLHKYWTTSENTGDEIITMLYITGASDFYVWYSEDWDRLDVTWNNLYEKSSTTLITNLINLTNNKMQPQRVTWLIAEWFTSFNVWEIDIYYKIDKDIETWADFTLLWTIDPGNTNRLAYMLTWIWKKSKYIQFKFKIWRTTWSSTWVKIKSLNII